MKIIVDEGMPRRLIDALRAQGCDVHRFPNDWKGLKNGRLLARLEQTGFQCLLTSDRNMKFQQNIGRSKIAVIVLPSQTFPKLAPIIGEIAHAIAASRPGEVVTMPRFSDG